MTCTVCGQPCIPMADYDYPVCHRCDASRDATVITYSCDGHIRAPVTVPLDHDTRRLIGDLVAAVSKVFTTPPDRERAA